MLRTFILNDDGSVSLSGDQPVAQSTLVEILELLQREDYAVSDVRPLISIEIKRAKTNISACTSSSELQKHRNYLGSLYLIKDYVSATADAVDFDEHRIERTELKIVEGEVFRFLREVAFRDDRLMEVGMEQASQAKTFGEVSPKFMIELISDGTPIGSFKLLLWDGTQTFIQDHVGLKLKPGPDSGAIILGPPDVDSTVQRAMRFPTHDAPYGSCRELFDHLCALIKKFTDLSPQHVSLAAYSVFASWFSDLTPVPVCVSIAGPNSHQRSNLFRLLSCLYRRPIVLGEISPAAICSLPMDLCPTLLVERYEFSQQLQKSLRASSARDIYIPRKGRLINTCCAKVICSEELLDNEELGQGALEIPVTSTRQPIPILEKYTQQEIASDFQPKLLRFRLTNYNRVRNSNFDVPEFESSARDLARCLGSCVSEDPELQTNIAPLLEDRNQEFSAYSDCSKYINGIVVETLFFLCHEENKGIVQVKEATSAVNTRLRNRGEMLEMTPKQVGNKLRAMGLTTMRLNAYGRGIRLLDPVRRRIHKLACDYGVAFGCTLKGDDPRWRCPYCARGARQAETEPLDIATLDELGI